MLDVLKERVQAHMGQLSKDYDTKVEEAHFIKGQFSGLQLVLNTITELESGNPVECDKPKGRKRKAKAASAAAE